MTPTQPDIFSAIRAYILSIISCEVIQGLGNGAAMPNGPFIALTAINQKRLSTNSTAYADATPTTGTKTIQQATQLNVQIDCYGRQALDWANTLSTLLRDESACSALYPLLQPLYADDPISAPLVNSELKYEQRWVVTASFQVNVSTPISMQFFNTATVNGIIAI
jgi:hypothetical protein